jgi:hypothetical protein
MERGRNSLGARLKSGPDIKPYRYDILIKRGHFHAKFVGNCKTYGAGIFSPANPGLHPHSGFAPALRDYCHNVPPGRNAEIGTRTPAEIQMTLGGMLSTTDSHSNIRGS